MKVDENAETGTAKEAVRTTVTPGIEDDGIELVPGQRMAINATWQGIDDKTCYEMLLLPRSADAPAIKKAYYKLSKEFHPDKFYRKNLGPYKEKLEIIFNKVNEAYRVLSDVAARAEYDQLVFGTEGKDAATQSKATKTVDFVPRSERAKEAARQAKAGIRTRGGSRKKAVPKFLQKFQQELATKILRSKEHLKKGEEALGLGQFSEAAANFQMAMTLDPRNTKAKVLFKRAQGSSRDQKAEAYFNKAQEVLLSEDVRRAAELMQQAVDCKPTRGKYYNGFGRLIRENTSRQRVALELLRKAVELEPRNVDFTMDLARAYEDLGMKTNAARAYERVLKVDSKRSDASKALRRLR
jgi:curved DNA-binding protein CbpA